MSSQAGILDIIIHKAGELSSITTPLDYSSLRLTEYATDQDQILVWRIFDESTVAALVSNPVNPDEKKTLFVLPKLGESGSPMYTVDSVNKTITFSTAPSDYNWEDVNHHGRGSDVQLPVASTSDTIVITKKTPLVQARIVWAPDNRIESNLLLSGVDQVLQAYQEWEIRTNNYTYLSFMRGTESGNAPLNSAAIVPDSYFPDGIGGSGSYTANLEGTRVETFGDVTDTMALDGWIFEYQVYDQRWTPRVMWKYLDDTGDAVLGGVLRRTGFGSNSKWTASQFKLHYLDQVFLRRDEGEHYQPKTAEIIQWNNVTDRFELAGLDSTFTEPTYDGWVLQWSTSRNVWEANSTIIDEVPVFNWVNEKYYLADLVDVHNNWVIFPSGTTWANRPDIDSSELTWLDDSPATKMTAYVLGFDAVLNKWRSMPYNFHRANNFWGGTTDTSDTTSPTYTGGYVGTNTRDTDAIHQYYDSSWIPYWDDTLYQKNQNPATEDPKGAFKVGRMFEWDSVITAEQAYAVGGRGDPNDDLAERQILTWRSVGGAEKRFHLALFSLDWLSNVETAGNGGIYNPRQQTYLTYDSTLDQWVPYEVLTGEEGWQKTVYQAKLERHRKDGVDASGNGAWEIVNQHEIYDVMFPVNGTIKGYKILDHANAIYKRGTTNAYSEPPQNNVFGFPGIPYNPDTAIPPCDFDLSPLDHGFKWVLSCVVDIDHIRVDYDGGSDTTTSLVTDAEASDTSSEWVTLNKSVVAGDIARVSFSDTNFGGISDPESNHWDWYGYGARLYFGSIPNFNPIFFWGRLNEQIGMATILINFEPDPVIV